MTRKPLLSGTVSAIVGAVALAAMAGAAFVPPPWNILVGLVGLLGAGLAGLAAPSFTFAAGAPKLQGTAFVVAGSVGALINQIWPAIPTEWQPIVLPVAGLLAWLTGRAMPALGTTPPSDGIQLPDPKPMTPVTTVSDAAKALNEPPSS